MKLSNAVEGWIMFKSTSYSKKTLDTNRAIFNQFLCYAGDVECSEITPQTIRDYLRFHKEERGLTPRTIKRYLAAIRSLFRWLQSPGMGIVDENPADEVAKPKLPKLKPRALKTEQIGAMIRAAAEGHNQKRDVAIVRFLFDTGCRASELCNLRLSDLDFRTRQILVMGKGLKERYVTMGEVAAEALYAYIGGSRPESSLDYVFLTESGDGKLNPYSLRQMIVRLAERCDPPFHATTHMLRHSAACQLLRSGLDVVSLSHYLGHSDISTTAEYLRSLRDSDVHRKVMKIAPGDVVDL